VKSHRFLALVIRVGLLAVPLLAVLLADLLPTPQRHVTAFRPPDLEGWSLAKLLGTDRQGRYFVPVLMKAPRPSLALGGAGTTAVLLFALCWGLAEGFSRRIRVVLAVVSVTLLALPDLAILAAVRGAWGSESGSYSTATLIWLTNTSLLTALVLLGLPPVSRVIAARVRQVVSSGYVRRTRAYGAGPGYVMLREVLPHLKADLAVLAAATLPRFIYLEAALSFLGLGYRGTEGLGELLTGCHQNVQNSVAQLQLLATTLTLVWVCLWPRFLVGLLRPHSEEQT
jgi:ABC-type dipeptide/oligopeptide/nickel transport system permease subunit